MSCPDNIAGGFSKRACVLWLSFLNNNTRYFEWGSGFTTKVSNNIVQTGISIEGSRDWFDQMKATYKENRTKITYVNIGETKQFSWPLNTTLGHEYIKSIKTYDVQDVILVDGRWRVACAANAYSRLHENSILMVHDFNRPQYHVLLNIYQKIREIDTLVILMPLPDKKHDAIKLTNKHTNNAFR